MEHMPRVYAPGADLSIDAYFMSLPDFDPRLHWLITSMDLGNSANASIREGLFRPSSLIYLSVGAVVPSLPSPLCLYHSDLVVSVPLCISYESMYF